MYVSKGYCWKKIVDFLRKFIKGVLIRILGFLREFLSRNLFTENHGFLKFFTEDFLTENRELFMGDYCPNIVY